MSETMRWCGGCEAETWFEVVVLESELMDELGCVDCGAAIVVGVRLPGLLDPAAEADLTGGAGWSTTAAPMAA